MMCDCVYCQGDKPWSGDPDEWPHTPPVYVFLALQDKDPNLWWRMSSGHGQNIAEDAIDMCEELTNECEELTNENKTIKSIFTDLIADLRDTYDDESDWHRVEHMYRAMYRAEARLREAQGE